MSQSGLPCILSSKGNPKAHLILRGSNSGPNYQLSEIEKLKRNTQPICRPWLLIAVMVIVQNPMLQPEVLEQIVAERLHSNVRGVMLESHLVDGNQKISEDMVYGQSVTDGCLGWTKTEQLLLNMADSLRCESLKLSA